MVEERAVSSEFPAGLADWAGHRSGGVRRMFDAGSGRPGGVFKTALLSRLQSWATDLAASQDAPSVLLLVGGPGNGKTEAVEATIGFLDAALRQEDRLAKAFAERLAPAPGEPVPRVALVTVQLRASDTSATSLSIVQDASVEDSSRPTKSAPELFLEELEFFAQPNSGIYIACVNRGVLDDALILATDQRRERAQELLESISKAVAVTAGAGSCWPLSDFNRVAIWPMDAESLLVPNEAAPVPPAAVMLEVATQAARWPEEHKCAAGVRCPFCHSRKLLGSDTGRAALLKILRYHELGTGKRWSFRDLFSLVPQLLAQIPESAGKAAGTPCEWASTMLAIDRGERTVRSERLRSVAIYALLSAGYEHVLFGNWDSTSVRQILADAKDVGLSKDPTLQGLAAFLRASKSTALPTSLKPLLAGLCDLLDPALSASEDNVQISTSKNIRLGDLDARFSQSVGAGLEFLIQLRCLSPLERELLGRLKDVDARLDGDIRISRPLPARRLQRVLREFACRLARRSIGAHHAVVKDARVFEAYQRITDAPGDHDDLLHAAAKNVESLLNTGGVFEIALNTTFGEPLPPSGRRATLMAPKQRVRPRSVSSDGRPKAPFRYLTIGSNEAGQPIPLTYDLYKAVADLGNGLRQASLPTTVVALLDSTKARLAGALVRNAALLEDASIKIGTAAERVVMAPKGFTIERGDRHEP